MRNQNNPTGRHSADDHFGDQGRNGSGCVNEELLFGRRKREDAPKKKFSLGEDEPHSNQTFSGEPKKHFSSGPEVRDTKAGYQKPVRENRNRAPVKPVAKPAKPVENREPRVGDAVWVVNIDRFNATKQEICTVMENYVYISNGSVKLLRSRLLPTIEVGTWRYEL